MRCQLLFAAASILAVAPARAASPLNLTVLGRVPLVAFTGYYDQLFVHDNLAFFSMYGSGQLFIYDVSDPANPAQLSKTKLPGGTSIADMHGLVYSNGVLWVGIAGSPTGGFAAFDVSDPSQPRQLSFQPTDGGTHNLRKYRNWLFEMNNAKDNPVDFRVWDISKPDLPTVVTEYRLPLAADYCHDVSVMEGVGYASFWGLGMSLLDVSDPRSITTLGTSLQTPQRDLLHSAWPSGDRKTVVTCQEEANLGVRFWDVSGPPPYPEIGAFQSHELLASTIVHDVMVVGDFAYITYYSEGVRILDIRDPTRPVEVASYLTANPPCTPFCSTIAQWVENGRLYVLDAGNGLWIFSFDLPHAAPITVYAVKQPGGQDAMFTWNHTGESQYTVRRGVKKQTNVGARMTDIDGEIHYLDAGAVPDGNLYYYRINGSWTTP